MGAAIFVVGATGHTGRRVAQELAAAGRPPVLVGRSAAKLAKLADAIGGADHIGVGSDWNELRERVGPRDVVVSTVGPFAKVGEPPLRIAAEVGATYFDSTGEPPFVRQVFERYDAPAKESGASLVPAFGYDFVPGNIAAELALREAGESATRVDVGYYLTGPLRAAAGPAARESIAETFVAPLFTFREGRLQEEPGGARMRSFAIGGRQRPALSIGATEHLALPRRHPRLDDVNVYLGWFGPLTPLMHSGAAFTSRLIRRPAVKRVMARGAGMAIRLGTREPTPASTAAVGSHIVAVAYDRVGVELATATLVGTNPLDYTGKLLAWAADQAVRSGNAASGALGPTEAFELEHLIEASTRAGIARPARAQA